MSEITKASSSPAKAALVAAESIQPEMLFNIIPSENDAVIIFYVSEYCCRSLVKSNKCSACKETIVQEVDGNLPLEHENVPTQATDFFNEINRGGLWKPTASIFNIGILCWRKFAEISMTGLKQKFMSSDNHREVFKEIVNLAFYDGYSIFNVHQRTCNN